MNKARIVKERLYSVESIDSITHILESIASIRIRQIRDEVLGSREFFQRLWSIFSQLRVSEKDLKRTNTKIKNSKQAVILVTANAGLTGEVDTHLVSAVLAEVDAKKTDFFVFGLHGENILRQYGIKPVQSFRFPEIGSPIDVSQCVDIVASYHKPLVYYPSYSSLTSQQISKIELYEAVQTLGEGHKDLTTEQIIFKDNCIFEPSISEVVNYLEQMMAGTILTEIILESNLAQYSSRFNAMSVASTRAASMSESLRLQYSRLKRHESDEANRRYTKHRKVTV